MARETIKRSIDILAPCEQIWKVLFDDYYIKIWYTAFGEEVCAETDWQLDSEVVFRDKAGNGLKGRIVVNRKYEVISVEYIAGMVGGLEDLESLDSKEMIGGRETYRLWKIENGTRLSIECDMTSNYLDSMYMSWDKALVKIKYLSENKSVI